PGCRGRRMITGTVNARHEIVIPVPVRDAMGQDQMVAAVLDTGFTGSLTVPPRVVASLGLTWRSQAQAVLANGTVEQFDIYSAIVVWDGVPRTILVQAIDTIPLLGMALLVGFDLRVRVRVGGRAEIQVIP
ncbi:MAG TPA: clan AA aspartic protease, partial [Gemmataceae bacterium]|nr:clan AA aspartic protease [Gemmataceae bacterium]